MMSAPSIKQKLTTTTAAAETTATLEAKTSRTKAETEARATTSIPITAQAIADTLHYVKLFSGEPILIKLGGSVLANHTYMQALCQDLTLLRAAGIKITLVHGGGKAINDALAAYHIPSEFIDGLRVTSADAMTVIEMVLGGQINAQLVRRLNALGVAAVGLTGADHQLIQCHPYSAQHGFVGKITAINTPILDHMITTQRHDDFGIIPVIAPIGVDAQGQAYNINADWVASQLAQALHVKKLIYITDQEGLLDQHGQCISDIHSTALQTLIQTGVATGGMMTKLHAITQALEHGVPQVHILNGQRPHVLLLELFTDTGIGTLCKPSHPPQVSQQ